jgi:hypothetical protein
VFDQVFLAIGQHGLGQAQLVSWLIGGIDPPAQASERVPVGWPFHPG